MEPKSSEELQESVCRNIGSSLTQVQRDVQTLREWLATQQHLPQYPCDKMLTTCLLACKNDMDKAKKKIDSMLTARRKMPDMFRDRDPNDQLVRDVAEELVEFPLPTLTPAGYRVILGYCASGDKDKLDLPALLKLFPVLLDTLVNHGEPYINGYYYVFDIKNLSMGQILKLSMSPRTVRQIINCLQDVYPMRIKNIVYINAPSLVGILLSMIKPFMKAKLFAKIQVHTEGPEILDQYFPIDMLPKDYGGQEKLSRNLNAWFLNYIEEHRDWLLHEGSLLTDETKRVKEKSSKKANLKKQQDLRTLSID